MLNLQSSCVCRTRYVMMTPAHSIQNRLVCSNGLPAYFNVFSADDGAAVCSCRCMYAGSRWIGFLVSGPSARRQRDRLLESQHAACGGSGCRHKTGPMEMIFLLSGPALFRVCFAAELRSL